MDTALPPLPLFRPPQGFRPAEDVIWAELVTSGPIKGPSRPTGARAAGMRYERKAHGAFQQRWSPEANGPLYAPAQWIKFLCRGETKARWCQPDGLILDFNRSRITILEMKLHHTQNAWWALRRLYEPTLRAIFGNRWSYSVCEVVRWHDPSVFWPEPLIMCPDPSKLPLNGFGVHLWAPERG